MQIVGAGSGKIFTTLRPSFADLFLLLYFLLYNLFSICCKAGLVALNSNFCLSEKLLISPPILNEMRHSFDSL